MIRPAPVALPPFRNADPRGRVDVAAYRLTEALFRRTGGGNLFDNGVGDVVEAVIAESGLPSKAYTAVDLARAAGILKKGGRR